MNFTDPRVDKYLYSILPQRDAVINEMERFAKQHKVPIVGPAVARMLAQYVELIGAWRIFELGSAIGYSTIWMARAAGPGAEVHYTDGNPANAQRAQSYIDRAGVSDRVRVHVGDALEHLAGTTGEFDLIFNDVDKHQYPEVFHKAVSRVRSGGLFITDNTLWSGRVARKAKPNDRNTRAIQQFNRLCYSSKELFPVLIPLRDGVLVCRKR
ncbi:MAG TPA: O-methyltransferase [Candidatus Acidoferrales bacterium]|nr:O-methyltransferase [Candidatus Acidoferrales bacterium]